MRHHAEIKRFLLEAIERCGGEPIPEDALTQHALIAYRHINPTVADLRKVLAELESERYAVVTTDDFTHQRLWVLSAKGQAQLRR